MSGMRMRNSLKLKPIKPDSCGNDWERIANKVASMPTITIPRRILMCDLERAIEVESSSENRAQAMFKMGEGFGVSITGSSILDPGASDVFIIIYLSADRDIEYLFMSCIFSASGQRTRQPQHLRPLWDLLP